MSVRRGLIPKMHFGLKPKEKTVIGLGEEMKRLLVSEPLKQTEAYLIPVHCLQYWQAVRPRVSFNSTKMAYFPLYQKFYTAVYTMERIAADEDYLKDYGRPYEKR